MTNALSGNYEIWVGTDRGRRLFLAENVVGSFGFTRVSNQVGAFTLSLPIEEVDDDLVRLDGMVEIWRGVQGAPRRLEFLGFIRKFAYFDDDQGRERLQISGPEVMDLLQTRIVAYAAGTSQAKKTDNADDMIKAIVRENLGASASADRDLSGFDFSVAGDTGQAPSISKAFAWRNVMDALQEICETSRQNGTELYFDILPSVTDDNTKALQFVTYIDQLGTDRTTTTSNLPALFGRDLGNLSKPVLEYDYMDEVSYVYAAGQGEESDRETAEAEDTTRSAGSVWNRREGFTDGRHLETSAALTDRAQGALEAGRPKMRFSGYLLDAPGSRYGRHWNYGDRVTAIYQGRQFDGMVKALRVRVEDSGAEVIEARLEVDS